jgi:hypothetical protein
MHPNGSHLLIDAVGLELRNKRTLLLATYRWTDAYNFIDWILVTTHVIKKGSDWLLILSVNWHRSENFLMPFVIIHTRDVLVWNLTNRGSIVRTYSLRHQVVLVRRWNKLLVLTHHLILVHMFGTFLRWSSGNVNLLSLTSHWRFHMHVLMRMATFHASGVVSLMINHFHLLSSILRVVEILGSLVEHMNLSNILHSVLHLLLMFRGKL